MKVGLSMLFCLGQPFSYVLRKLDNIQVENIELVDEGLHALNTRRVHAVKKIIRDRRFQVTVHAPFVDVNPASPAAPLRRATLRHLKQSIRISSQMGVDLWVFHSGLQTGISHFHPELDWNIHLKSVRELLDASEQSGVKIAIENTPDPFPFLLKSVKDFVHFYEDLGEENLALTLDVGHANINSQIYEFLEKFPHKIVHAHLHDNKGGFDEHLGIGYGNIDWPKVIRAFKNADYRGTLIVESEKNVEESLQKLRTLVQTV